MMLVDVREHYRAKVKDQLERWGVPSYTIRLEYGDYAIPEYSIGVSRKGWGDFLSSWNKDPSDGPAANMFEDLRRLRDFYNVAIFLLEGIGPDCFDTQTGFLCRWESQGGRPPRRVLTGISIDAWNNFVLSIQLKGVLFIPSADLDHTIIILRDLHRYASKPVHHTLSALPKTPKQRRVQMFAALPGVGEKKGTLLAEHFATVRELVENPKAVEAIQGFGPKTAAKIAAFINGEVKDEAASETESEGQ